MELFPTAGHKEIRVNEIAKDLARLGAGQPIVGTEPAVEISGEQIKEHFRLREEEDNKEPYKEAQGYRQALTVFGEKI